MAPLALEHPHPRDARIEFDAGKHAYRIRGEGPGSPFVGRFVASVTALVAARFPPFDADAVIAANWRRWQNDASSRYRNMDPGSIKELWLRRGEQARRLGTALHAAIEAHLNGARPPDADGISGLEREWSLFLEYRRHACWVPWRTEFAVFDEASRVCGTVDALVRALDGSFLILDWKRSAKDLGARARDWGRRGTGGMPDTPHHRYSLQLSIYRLILETRYGIPVSACVLVGLHPERGAAQVVRCTDHRPAAREVLGRRARLVRSMERWTAAVAINGRRARGCASDR